MKRRAHRDCRRVPVRNSQKSVPRYLSSSVLIGTPGPNCRLYGTVLQDVLFRFQRAEPCQQTFENVDLNNGLQHLMFALWFALLFALMLALMFALWFALFQLGHVNLRRQLVRKRSHPVGKP